MTRWHRLTSHWVEFSIHRPWTVLGGVLVATLIALILSLGIKIRGDFAALLPDHYPSVRGFETITKKVGGLGFMMVVVEGKDPHKVKDLVERLLPQFEALKKYIRFVQIYKIDPFIQKRLLYLVDVKDLRELNRRLIRLKAYIKAEERRKILGAGDLLEEGERLKPVKFDDLLKKYHISEKDIGASNLIGSRDGRTAVMLLQPAGLESDLKFIYAMIHALQKTVQLTLKEHPKKYASLKVGYTGRYMVRMEDDQALRSQLSIASLISLVGVLFLLLLYTRRKRSLMLIGMPLIVGVIWTGGIVRLMTGGEINIMTAFIVAVLFGLGIDFGIHLFSHYLQERRAGNSLQGALDVAITSTGAAGIVAVTTSAAAFFVIQLTDFKGLSQFGLVAGVGLLVILATMFIVFPSLAVLIERNSPLGSQDGLPRARPQTSKVNILAFELHPHPLLWTLGLTLGLMMLIGGTFVISTRALQFENNIWRLITQGPAVKLYNRLKRDIFEGETEPGVILLPNHKKLREVQRKLSEGIAHKKWKTVRIAYSVQSILPKDPKLQQVELKKMAAILSDEIFEEVPDKYWKSIERLKKLAQAHPYTLKDLPKRLKGVLGGGLPLLFIVPAINPTQGDKAMQYAKDLHRIDEEFFGGKMIIGDSNLILADMFHLMKRDGLRAVIFALIAVLLVLLYDLRDDIKGLLLVLAPLIVGVSGMLTIMWLFTIKLNPFNVVMLPVTLGLGIDHGVYMYHRWREKGKGPVMRSLKPLFYAIVLASTTSLIGFGSLMTAQHKGIHDTGLLAALGIASTTIAAFVVLPTIFSMLAYRKYKLLSSEEKS